MGTRNCYECRYFEPQMIFMCRSLGDFVISQKYEEKGKIKFNIMSVQNLEEENQLFDQKSNETEI